MMKRTVISVILLAFVACQASTPSPSKRALRYMQAADNLARKGELIPATDEAAKAVTEAPQHAPAQLLLGRLLREAGQITGAGRDDQHGYYERATVALTRARELDPTAEGTAIHLALLHADSGRDQEGIDILSTMSENSSPELRFHLASLLAGVGDYEQATALYEAGLADQPTDTKAIRAYASALTELGEFDRALEQCTIAVRQDPRQAANFYEFGSLLAKTGDDSLAVLALARAVEIDPYFDEALYALGRAQRRLGQREAKLAEGRFAEFKEQDKQIQRLQESLPGAPDRFTEMAAHSELSRRYMDRGLFVRARAAAMRVTAVRPGDARSRIVLAELAAKRGDLTAALAEVDYAIKSGRDDPGLVALHGRLLLASGRNDEARPELTKAFVLGDRSGPLLEDLARLAIADRRPEKALQITEEGLDLDRFHAPLFKVTGHALVALGRRTEAVRVFQAYLRWQPADVEVLTTLADLANAVGDVKTEEALRGRIAFLTSGVVPAR